MRTSRAVPLSVRRALSKLGQDLSVARRRRRIPMALMAERAFISSRTLSRVERGDPRVALGIYATVLFVLGMAERVAELADPKADRLGLALDEERLPKRVRSPRRSSVR
jgi:transcriptional regulator with XRE-family HTH domain